MNDQEVQTLKALYYRVKERQLLQESLGQLVELLRNAKAEKSVSTPEVATVPIGIVGHLVQVPQVAITPLVAAIERLVECAEVWMSDIPLADALGLASANEPYRLKPYVFPSFGEELDRLERATGQLQLMGRAEEDLRKSAFPVEARLISEGTKDGEQ